MYSENVTVFRHQVRGDGAVGRGASVYVVVYTSMLLGSSSDEVLVKDLLNDEVCELSSYPADGVQSFDLQFLLHRLHCVQLAHDKRPRALHRAQPVSTRPSVVVKE